MRDFIKEHCQILAIVSLPSFAFSPYGAGVKSSILFLRKKDPSETLNDYDIFMASADHIGYDATGRITSKNDLDVINKKYHKFLESN